MVTNIRLDSVFTALGDPVRRSIVDRLGEGPATVGQIADPFPISRPAISKHLRVLERAGLIRRDGETRTSPYALEAERLREATNWLERYRRFWEHQLDRLGNYIDTHPTEK